MKKENKNNYVYARNRKRRKWGEIQKDVKGTALYAGKQALLDGVVGLVLGGATGAIIGKPSLIIGLPVNFAGHFLEIPLLSTFGLGMAAANGFQGDGIVQLSGTESFMDSAKKRLINYKNTMLEKTYLDKLGKKTDKKDTASDQPVGEVKYFVYPHSEDADMSGMDLTALDQFENQVMQSAQMFQNKQPEPMAQSMNGNMEEDLTNDPLY